MVTALIRLKMCSFHHIMGSAGTLSFGGKLLSVHKFVPVENFTLYTWIGWMILWLFFQEVKNDFKCFDRMFSCILLKQSVSSSKIIIF